MNPLYTPLHRLHQARLDKVISTKQIVQAVIQHINQFDEQVKCFLQTNEQEALAIAEKIDEQIRQGNPVDLIAGMPLAIKDIFNITGKKTTCASKILENYVAPYESTVTQHLKDKNYALIGKTNMDEFAMGSSTEHSAFFNTKNPCNQKHVPGGSSGGSAAAVAAGFCVGAIGTDTGGSIRQPAGFCGVVGLKPTYGRVSRYGMVAFASSFDQAGPITFDVADAGLLLERISGYDHYDQTSHNIAPFQYQSHQGKDIKGKKLGVIQEIDLKVCSDEVQENYYNNLNLFEKAGGQIVNISISNIRHAVGVYYVLASAEASSNLGRFDAIRYGVRQNETDLANLYQKSRQYGLGEEVKLRILLGTFVLSAGYYDAYYGKAQAIKQLIQKQFKQAFTKVDGIALPVAPTTAFAIGEMADDRMQMYLADLFTLPANIAGIPGICIPSGWGKNNLPIGFQILADSWQEDSLIHFGQWFEEQTKQPPRKPFFIK